MINSPCLNCTKRKLGCHSTCDRHKEFQEKNGELKAKRRAENAIYEVYRDYKEEKVKRLKGGRK